MTTLTIVPPLHFQRPPAKLLTLDLSPPSMCALLEPLLAGESFPCPKLVVRCVLTKQRNEGMQKLKLNKSSWRPSKGNSGTQKGTEPCRSRDRNTPSAVCPLVTRVGGRCSAWDGRRQALHSPEDADERRPPRPFTIVLRGGSGGLCGEDFIPTDQLLSAGSN